MIYNHNMNKCRNCGGRIRFSPLDKANKCDSCSKTYPIKYDYMLEKNNYLENSNIPLAELKDARKIKCNSCGANVILKKHEAQAVCPYCSSSEIIVELPEGMNKVDSIIPFTIDNVGAFETVKNAINKSFFANKSIIKTLRKEDLVGIYANSIVFDIDSQNKYKGILYKNVVRKNSDGSQTTTTKPFPVAGTMDYNADNIVIEANYNITQRDMDSISPYDHKEKVKFENDFMNGYLLEYQDKDISTAYENANSIIKNRVKNMIVRKYNADGITTLTIDTEIKEAKYEHSLLPIYTILAHHKNKDYRILMNGQTGKVSNIPKSGLKIFGLVTGILAFIGIIIVLSMVF